MRDLAADRAPGENGAVSFLGHVATLAAKDLRVEFRSREIIYTMTFFAAMVVIMFSFAFVGESKDGAELPVGVMAPGFLWISVLFAGTLGLSRSLDRERESDTLRGLLLSPTPRAAIFLGKSVGVFCMIALVEVVVVPLTSFFFDVPLFGEPLPLLATLFAGTVGFSVVGSVFAAMLLRVRSRDVLLPVILYPILAPLLIAAVKATAGVLDGSLGDTWFWIKFLAVYDVAFLTVALWTFENLVIE